ncbi:hypothetical protein DD595_25285, partial [Enterobacter cloacae complex sp. 4DZ3-17B2]
MRRYEIHTFKELQTIGTEFERLTQKNREKQITQNYTPLNIYAKEFTPTPHTYTQKTPYYKPKTYTPQTNNYSTYKNYRQQTEKEKTQNTVEQCFKCGQRGHYKRECPKQQSYKQYTNNKE